MARDHNAVGFEVRNAVAVVVADADGFAQKREMVARLFFEVA
jgi:hypothetical protein